MMRMVAEIAVSGTAAGVVGFVTVAISLLVTAPFPILNSVIPMLVGSATIAVVMVYFEERIWQNDRETRVMER